jgi:transglutaminase/protease-like cytokinesis protein 3
VVHGYARGVGSSPFTGEDPSDSNHAWNMVNIEGAWYFIDSTWDAGHLGGRNFQADYDTDYLFIKPEHFIYNHFPENPRQQLLEKPVSPGEFSNFPFFRPKFFEVISGEFQNLDKLVKTEGKIELEFSMKDGFIPDIEVYDGSGDTSLEYRSFVQKEGNVYKAYLSFPSPGNYIVRLFARKQNARSSEFCAELGVVANAGTGVMYPLQYTSFDNTMSIISPIEMPLRKNIKYEFRVWADDKKFMALMYDRNLIPFQKDEDGMFFLEVEIPPNIKEVMIGTAESTRGSYRGIVGYLVN